MQLLSNSHVMSNPKTLAAIRAVQRRERLERVAAENARLAKARMRDECSVSTEENSGPERAKTPSAAQAARAAQEAAAAEERRTLAAVRGALRRFTRLAEQFGPAFTMARFIEIDTGLSPEVAERLAALRPADVYERLDNAWRPSLDQIMVRVSRVTGISVNDIRSARRERAVAFARQMFFYWAIRLTRRSFPQVGRFCGKRDHTTVLHGVDAYVAKRASMGRQLRPLRASRKDRSSSRSERNAG